MKHENVYKYIIQKYKQVKTVMRTGVHNISAIIQVWPGFLIFKPWPDQSPERPWVFDQPDSRYFMFHVYCFIIRICEYHKGSDVTG